MNATEQPSPQTDVKPTIVLVHGAFAEASSWSGVIELLQRQGYTASLLGQIGHTGKRR